MTCEVGRVFSRDELQAMFPALGERLPICRDGSHVTLLLKRQNSGEYSNWFHGRTVTVEINSSKREHNTWLRDPDLTKCLYWSERGGEYVCLGPMIFKGDVPRSSGAGPFFKFELTDPSSPIPRR